MNLSDQKLNAELQSLRKSLPELGALLQLNREEEIKSWNRVIDGKLLPRLSPDFPLTAAICGGGSAGKSTLFNTLIGDRLSPSGGRAGINRRILVSAPGELFRNREFLSTLFEPFGAESRPLKDKTELTVPGCPLYVLSGSASRNMVLMDTPDIDTGAKGAYENRDVVRQALETSDIMIYIFTNATYTNRDNTDFISEMLTGIGVRKCILVYRIDSKADHRDVMNHAMTVAKNLYGSHPEPHILGIYRTDEDNAVASGERFMTLIPVRPVDIPIADALKNLDPYRLRPEILASILSDVLGRTKVILAAADESLKHLRRYHDALIQVHQRCAREALVHFPMDMVLKRFVEIWLSTDPAYVRTMRKTGDVVGYPAKILANFMKWLLGKMSSANQNLPEHFKNVIESDLINAVHMLRIAVVSPDITGLKDEPPTPVHPSLFPEQEKFRNLDWLPVVERIVAQKEIITSFSEGIESELAELAAGFRKRMDFSGKVWQTFSAFLNVLPATVAITYILQTGDPVGAAGIKVKLSGIFGLHDLYALIAIPTTTGLNKADRKQLESLLGPIAQTWLNDKFRVVHELFVRELTGDILSSAEVRIRESEKLIREIKNLVKKCRQIFPSAAPSGSKNISSAI